MFRNYRFFIIIIIRCFFFSILIILLLLLLVWKYVQLEDALCSATVTWRKKSGIKLKWNCLMLKLKSSFQLIVGWRIEWRSGHVMWCEEEGEINDGQDRQTDRGKENFNDIYCISVRPSSSTATATSQQQEQQHIMIMINWWRVDIYSQFRRHVGTCSPKRIKKIKKI